MDKSQAYRALGLPDGAGEEDVKRAYRDLAKKYSADSYDAGPLRDDAEARMNEINLAFDALMSYLRTGSTTTAVDAPAGSTAYGGNYAAIRQMLANGKVDEALAELSAVQNGGADAEWNYLMGSAYYHKGWLDQALLFFQQAVRLDPNNREYQAALQNLQNSSDGNMQGSPYTQQDQSAAAMNCACNTCTMMCCMDALCGMCRGF
ncbi:tetratricopeptide repeat protein [Ruminococcaceae bacterium OttesenSCG-928-O06]|nr:tetratricopeptide repeat protein [Ruminococcaceae bacterium OttesenSCG-928-O06]